MTAQSLDAVALVPVKPTLEMLEAPNTIVGEYAAKLVWKRMIDAAPDWHPTPEAINVLPQALREYVLGLERALGDGWVAVADRLPDDGVLVMVYAPDTGDGEIMDFDGCEEGRWVGHDNRREHFLIVGGADAAGPDCICTGPAEEAPYTHWRPLPPPPDAMAAGPEGE